MSEPLVIDDPILLEAIFDVMAARYRNLDFTDTFRDKVFPWLQEQHAEHFAHATSPGGEPWKPLAPSTVAKKGHNTILIDLGDLALSLAGVTGDSIREAEADYAVFGTSDEKSPFHTTGTSRMPKREHVGTNEDGADKIAGMIADHAVSEVGKPF